VALTGFAPRAIPAEIIPVVAMNVRRDVLSDDSFMIFLFDNKLTEKSLLTEIIINFNH
jgi:hypothetical protein